jgi:hypothetical protein
MSPKTKKRKAARKLHRWRHSSKPPRLRTEKHWRNRIRKGRLPESRRTHVICWEADGDSFMLNLKTFKRVYLTDWRENSTCSTVEI